MTSYVLPSPTLVVLIGVSGSGKSTWAADRYGPLEIVSSDHLRAIVANDEQDLGASADAFALLDLIVAARLRRGLTTVVDTIGFSADRRRAHRELARRAGLPTVAVLFSTDPAECRRRNSNRAKPIPAADLDSQLHRMPDLARRIADEGWDIIHHATM
jgi:predicted kinase